VDWPSGPDYTYRIKCKLYFDLRLFMIKVSKNLMNRIDLSKKTILHLMEE
jgi:hypothetical protein